MTNETTASQPTPHQNTLDAITGAIAYGRQGTNPPPSPDHWLAEYWSIGQQLAELGKTSAWDNVTPTASQPKSIGDDAQFCELLRDYMRAFNCDWTPTAEVDDKHQKVIAYIDNFRAPADQASATIQAAPNLLNLKKYKQTWDSTSQLIERKDGDYYKVSDVQALLAAPMVADPAGVDTVIGCGNPESAFAEFCEVNGYPSDGEMDAALRSSFYEGIKFCMDQPRSAATFKAVPSEALDGVVSRKAFVCTGCECVYADEPVSACDCMVTPQSYIEGEITYFAAPLADKTGGGE